MTEGATAPTGVMAFALSYQSLSGDLPPHAKHLFSNREGEPVYLSPMTSLFRQAFRATFASARKFAVKTKPVKTAAATVRVTDCYVFSTAASGIGDGDLPDRLLVALAEVTPLGAGTLPHDCWSAHYRAAAAKQTLLRDSGLGPLLDCLALAEGRVAGNTSAPVDFAVGAQGDAVAATFAFHVLGWISAMRITRRQLSLKLAPVAAMSEEEAHSIADQRMRIINQQRYFLTTDRTNNLDFRKFCRDLTEKYQLQKRFDVSLNLHEAFEHHLDNSAKLHNAKQLGSVSNLILILTILSVPISAFSAVFAINLKSDALDRPWDIVSDYRLYATLLVGALWVALPFIVLRTADRLRRL